MVKFLPARPVTHFHKQFKCLMATTITSLYLVGLRTDVVGERGSADDGECHGTHFAQVNSMNKQRMIFEIDRRSVTEGDVVEINWQCEGAEEVKLTIDNGFRSSEMSLETSGNKKFRLNRSKGKTHLTLTVKTEGKEHHKTIDVRVKKMPTIKADTVDNNGKKMGLLSQWWQKGLSNWHNFMAKVNLALSALPERKQVIVKMMTLLGVMLIVSAIWPKAYNFIMVALIVYLAIALIRK